MLERRAAPKGMQAFVNRAVIPAMIDAAASVERQVEKASVRARKAPVTALAVAIGFGWLLAWLLRLPRSGRQSI